MIVKKKFVELASGKIFEVIDQFEDIAILDNRAKVKVHNLFDKNLYDEYIDPNSFFRNESLVNAFTEKIKQIPLDKNVRVEESRNPFSTQNFSESAVLPYDPEEEKRELMEKAKRMQENQNYNTNRQLDKFSGLIEEDEIISNMRDVSVSVSMDEESPQIASSQPTIQREPNIIEQTQTMDPILSMFRNVKRNTDFEMTFSIKNKIPRLDFIEMMEDSYNTSIIEFLAEEFTNNILINPDIIKSRISDEIRRLVFSNQESQEETKTPKKPTKKLQSEHD